MASSSVAKGLPPPPLRIDKRRNASGTTQPERAHQQWTSYPGGSNASSASGPSHLAMASDAPAQLTRTNSGRFRLRKPSLTRQSKTSEAGPSNSSALLDNSANQLGNSQASNKAWQPRWAPKLKRTNPSESVTTYSPILSPPLPPLPTSVASPPPAVQLDDAGFGRPFSTTGLLDLNASRFSFLDMSDQNHSDSGSEGEHVTPVVAPQLPTIEEPPMEQRADAQTLASASLPANTGHAHPSPSVSSITGDASHDTLRVPPSSSLFPDDDSRSRQNSLQGSSPALGSLISSFPSPLTRDAQLSEATSSKHLQAAQQTQPNDPHVLEVPVLQKQKSWDGGERWDAGRRTDLGMHSDSSSTELPYLDMDEDDETELLEISMPHPSGLVGIAPRDSSVSPPRTRLARNPPPRPAPTMALPELPAKPFASSQADFRSDTPPDSLPLDLQQQDGSSRQVQRPLILPTLRSSSSVDRLAAMQGTSASSHSSPSEEPAHAKVVIGSNLKPLTLQRTASTDEIAKSLDIPRDTVKQMLDTTQHVWRNHLLGSSAVQNNGPSSSDLQQMPRSSSSPMLSTLFASQGTSDSTRARDDLSKGSVAKSSANRLSNRGSTLGLPYISSTRPSFEQQSPGWAVSKGSTSTTQSQGERSRHRRTFLGGSSEDGATASYNFSRPIRRDPSEAEGGLDASASMPTTIAGTDAPKPLGLLQSPLLLKGESEATGFAQLVIDDDEEVLADSGSEAHVSNTIARQPPISRTADARAAGSTPLPLGAHKPVPELPQQGPNVSPRLVRRNSDTVLNRFAPEFGKRAPGELHAWSVCIDNDGVPAIRPSPSAFHRPNCPLAGKNNATWQCGCRTVTSADPKVSMSSNAAWSSIQSLAVPGQASPGRNRSLSASNAMDSMRQAQLWSQLERNNQLIRKHEQEIAGLQEEVVRISTEMASARPSLSSTFATPEIASASTFPTLPAKVDASARKPLPSITSSESDRSAPPVPSKGKSVEPFPSVGAAPASEMPASASAATNPPRTLRGRIASLSKLNLAARDDETRASQSLDLQHSRMGSSSSSSSLNKVFRFPWSKSTDKLTTFPQPTPFPMGQRKHGKAASASTSRNKDLPHVRMYSADGSRPLPAPPIADAMLSNKDKRYPPSSRKFSYDTLHGPAFHSSVGPRHLRDRSGSSKSSSLGTSNSIFSMADGNEMHETSRFATFSKFGRRWDSISSRGTAPSARNSAEVGQAAVSSYGSMPTLSALATKPMPSVPGDAESAPRSSAVDQSRRPRTPPPRRSSLRRSSEVAPVRTPIPPEFLQVKDAVMAPISEQSEMGSPASARADPMNEMSPASVVGASPAGPVRMSMSERYRLQGLTVPAPLPLSSSLTSPALGSASELGSGAKVGESPRSSTSPKSVRSPLPVAFSHGALTVSRPLKS